MASVQKGRGIVWSVGTITYTAGITDATEFAQSLNFSRESEKAEIKDADGVIRSQVYHGFIRRLSLTVVPCALAATNTIANARTQADAHLLTPGTLVTLTDGHGANPATGPIIDGNYSVISATENRTVDGVVTIDLELENADEGVDITAAVGA